MFGSGGLARPRISIFGSSKIIPIIIYNIYNTYNIYNMIYNYA